MAPRLDVVGIVVSDMARSLAFYRHLGLDVPASADSEEHAEFVLPNGFRVLWDTEDVIRSFDSSWTRPTSSGRVDLACLVDSPQEVDDLYHTLLAAGATSHKAPWDAFWGQRYAIVLDPDGVQVALFAALG